MEKGIYVLCFLCVFFTSLQVVISDTGYFWHITDFHYDFTYHGRQLSCNKTNVPDNVGQFGDFWCDSPWLLVNSSVRAMADIKSDVDFVLWTGDTVLHGKNEDLSYDINAGILENVTEVIKTTLPGVPVYATFGNHDYFPNNQFPPNNNLLYNDTLNRWKSWLDDPSQHDNFRKGAYYTKKTRYGLRIVALNTNLYYTSNKAILNYTDPADQIAWLNSTLTQAKTNKEKVLVTAHIPPRGTHTPNSLPGGMFSVTYSPAHNPGIRLVKYDRSTGIHLEIEQHYLDLLKANKNGAANWELEYKTSSHYGLNKLTAADLSSLAERMKKASSKEFKNYWNFYTVTPPDNLAEACNEDCHSSVICGFTEFDMDNFKSCKASMVSTASRLSIAVVYFLIKLVFLWVLLN
ncbi:acid sphingomyelinase-like phosphodiesterase 3a [Ruditapes philippinarum]|uniref:acid sphingomyelinase-like phosphodiesterase 3a n=1 Tax=Ruditapes philippinarum TaxID=129788 RepID=UPI00295AA898|nr:acid sphingomyelinase-like phosphodiesterase 3a [Ruditapes philippinarum]